MLINLLWHCFYTKIGRDCNITLINCSQSQFKKHPNCIKMWGDSRAKLDYAELACKPNYSMHLKKNVLQKKAFWKKWWKYKFKTNIHVSLFILDCSWKKRIRVFFPCFYCDLWYSLWKTKTHSLSIAWPTFEQSK